MQVWAWKVDFDQKSSGESPRIQGFWYLRSMKASATNGGSSPLRLVRGTRPFSGASDRVLIDAFGRGEAGASAELYDRLAGIIRGTLYKMLGRETSDFDDLVQTSFEQVVSTLRRRTFGQECRLTSWGGAIASHVALNAIRRSQNERARTVQGALEGVQREPAAPVDTHEQVAARRELERLRRFLSEMRRERAVPLILCDVLGHTLEEAASAEGVSEAALQSRLTRGRSELRQRFDADLPRGEGAS